MHTNTLIEVRTALRNLLPPGVVSSAGSVTDTYPPLAHAELTATGCMNAIRLQEFTAGRAHAKIVLQELGLLSPIVPLGTDRAPLWPPGFVGSISHAGALVLAVAAPNNVVRAVGVDLELATLLDTDLVKRVCRPEELAQLQRMSEPRHGAKLVFSAKESVYKCVAPQFGVFFEFAAVEILFDMTRQQFHARGHGPADSLIGPDTINGGFAEAGGYWITAAWQRPQPGQATLM